MATFPRLVRRPSDSGALGTGMAGPQTAVSPAMLRLCTFTMLALIVPDKPVAPAARGPQCVRLAGEQIGQLPFDVEIAGRQVKFLEWKATDITADQLIGFRAEAPAGVRFSVEAGESEFAASADWLHPAGVVGPRVKPIRAVTLCAN